MAKRTQRLSDAFLASAPDGSHSEPGNTKGCYLEIVVRYGGKSKRAYFRYNGIPFGEKRGTRVPLGSCDQGLKSLRRQCVALEDLIEQGKSPTRYRKHQQEQRAAAGMTFREAFEEFWGYASKRWSPGTLKQTKTVRNLHIEPLAIMDMPLDTIRASHLEEALGEKWHKMRGSSSRMRSLIHSTFQFQMDKDDGVFRGPSPASWRKTSSLSRRLGPQLEYIPRPNVHFEDIPRLMAYLCAPQDHWVAGYLTTPQAAYALGRLQMPIRTAAKRGWLKGVLKTEAIWGSSKFLIPIPELKRRFGEFVHEPKPQEHESARLHARVLKFLIFSPVRIANVCELRWRNIQEDNNGGIIEYLPKRRDRATGEMLPSEHKLGWTTNIPYIVILTDNLRALIEAQRQQQIHDGIAIKPDGFVFMHAKSPTGADRWFNKLVGHTSANNHLTRAVKRLSADGPAIRIVPADATEPVVHGFRTTFTTWAKENFYSDDLINLSLGHIIPAIKQNQTNWSYFYNVQLLDARRKMMEHWEQYSLSLVEPQSNIVPIKRKRR